MALDADFFDKFPGETLDFEVDCSPLTAGGDAMSNVQASSSDVVASVTSFSNITSLATLRVSGGVAGAVAKVVVEADMASGQIRQKPVFVLIKPL
jgi:hypothetical protein